MKRKRHFRGVLVTLECGCDRVLSSSFYRLTSDRASAIVMDNQRRGVWCHKHGGMCMMTKVKGVVRL